MKTLYLKKEQIYKGNLLLVNARHPLHGKVTGNMVMVDARCPDLLLRRDAANVLQLIFEKIAANNAIVPVSGYRSQAEQELIFKDSLQKNGEAFTRNYVALPGCSEHQTGLAIDLGLAQTEIDFIRPAFPENGICGKFKKVAPAYGYIERYIKGKEHITGIAAEPWHFRYVGYPHSQIMAQAGLSLEEYIEMLKGYSAHHKLVYPAANDRQIEIYYVPYTGKDMAVLVQEGGVYQISGNNVDGVIVTMWRPAV